MKAQEGKRGWSRTHKAIAWSSLLICIAAMLVALEALRAATMKPTIKTDFAAQINKLAEQQLPPGAAIADWNELTAMLGSLSAFWPDGQEAGPEVVVARLDDGARATLRRLPAFAYAAKRIDSRSSIAWQTHPTRDDGIELGPVRATARLLRCELQVACKMRDAGRIREVVDQLDALTTACYVQPTQYARWSGLSLDGLIDSTVRDAIVADQLTPETARMLLDSLHAMRPRASVDYTLETTRLLMQDKAQRIFTDDGNGDGSLITSSFAEQLLGAAGMPYSAKLTHWRRNMFEWNSRGRAESLRDAESMLDEIIADGKLTRSQRRDDASWKATSDAKLQDSPVFAEWYVSWPFVRLQECKTTARTGNELQLALHLHRQRTGHYPTSLTELVPAELSAVPVDPLAVDGTFRYGSDGTTYTLYTVGVDGVDNSGKMRDKEPFRALRDPENGTGYDFVFSSDAQN